MTVYTIDNHCSLRCDTDVPAATRPVNVDNVESIDFEKNTRIFDAVHTYIKQGKRVDT